MELRQRLHGRGLPVGKARRRLARAAARSFDHLVGAGEQGRGKIETKRFRGSKIDNEFELRRLLDRQLRGFLSPEDAVNIAGGTPI